MSAYDDWKKRQYDIDLMKDIEVGDMVQVTAYYVSDSGLGKVTKRFEEDGVLKLKVLRIMKNDYTLIKRPKELIAEVGNTEKIDVDTLIQNLMSEVNNIQAQFLAYK